MKIKTALAAVALAPLLAATTLAQDTPGAPNHDELFSQEEVYGKDAPTERARKADARRARPQAQAPVRGQQARGGATAEDAEEPDWKPNAVRESEAAWRLSARTVSLNDLSQDQVKDLQEVLEEQGYYHAEIDGIPGRQTRLALRQFYETQSRLARSGRIVPEAAETLGLDSAEVQRVSGQEPPERETLRGSQEEATPAGTPSPEPAPERDPAPTDEEAPANETRRTHPDRNTPPEE